MTERILDESKKKQKKEKQKRDKTVPQKEPEYLKQICGPLLDWYHKNRRILPWREEATPYRVWISEIMLQQTRVEAGRGYFERFTAQLPDVEALANVEDEQLMKLWEGLGYYNRARNLKKAAGIVMEQYGGEIPPSYEELLKLPGIGPYTAGAISSIAFGIAAPAVDGNVLRVVSRIMERRDDIAQASVKKAMEEELGEIMPREKPGDFNQALMELGAIVCIPNGAPKCGECPVSGLCRSRAAGTQEEIPVKKSKKERRIEEKTVLILIDDAGRMALRRRPEKGLLSGLWELPSLEGTLNAEQVKEALEKAGVALADGDIEGTADSKHIFSHVEWRMKGYRIRVQGGEDQALQEQAEKIQAWNGQPQKNQNRNNQAQKVQNRNSQVNKAGIGSGNLYAAEEHKVYLKDVEERRKKEAADRERLRAAQYENAGAAGTTGHTNSIAEGTGAAAGGETGGTAIGSGAEGFRQLSPELLMFADSRELAEQYALPSAFKGFSGYFPGEANEE